MTRSFDGIICFGGLDWWYHNRGHYDLQMMREFSRELPVLYVNSLGMRTPRVTEGKMFFKRATRKFRSFLRGYREIRPGFSVLSPISVPFLRATGAAQSLLAHIVRRGARRMGIHDPLIWVNCPPAAEVLPRISHSRLVYQRTDRFEEFPDTDRAMISRYDRRLKQADLTLYCSTSFYEEERDECRNALFIDHGVDYEHFASAETRAEPADLGQIPRPRVGFIGGIDPHTFDPELFVRVARELPELAFVMVGKDSLPEGWCTEKNVHFLGQRPYEDVASYMAACEVLIMPWQQNNWIKACNPIKLKEYLSVGRPIVSTSFDELRSYAGVVTVDNAPSGFAAAVRRAIVAPPDPATLRARVEHETWSRKAEQVMASLDQLDRDDA